MPKIAKALTPLEIERLTMPGQHAVGTVAGLRLAVKPSGARSWILRTTVGGRRTDIGLGGFPTVTLAQACERARTALDDIKRGTDPVAERRSRRATIEWTFKKTAEAYIDSHRAGWKNLKHAQQWENTLSTYVYPVFGSKHVRDVSKADVLAVLSPDWSKKNETMVRLRNRIELILNYAVQLDYRPEGQNPARWRGNLDGILPRPAKVNKREHFEALPINAMHGFMERLQKVEGMAARALEFVILTASRTGTVRLAEWPEIDLQAAVWSIPGEKMKGGRPHRVPLSDRALELLEALPRHADTNLVFPGARAGRPLSDMSLTQGMRRLGLTAVPHGFRSTFADWCSERTNTPGEVREMALAHAIGDSTEEAYRRGDLFERRRLLMADWAQYISTPVPTANVRPMRRRVAS